MPSTITSFWTFIAGTKARANQVNTNFSNFRGDLLPINENTITASHETHDLGNETHRWKEVHLKGYPVVNGSTMTSGRISYNNFLNFVHTATSNNYFEYATTTSHNPAGFNFDDLKIRMGVERVNIKKFIENEVAMTQGAPSISGYGFKHIAVDQYGDKRKDFYYFVDGIKETTNTGYYVAPSVYAPYNIMITNAFTGVNLFTQATTSGHACTNVIYDSSVNASFGFSTGGYNLETGLYNARCNNFTPIRHGLSLGCHSIIIQQNTTGSLNFSEYELVNNSTLGVYPTGIVNLAGVYYTLAGATISWSTASYTGSKGARAARYIFESSGIAVSELTMTSILEGATLAFSGLGNTNTGTIIQNDGKYLNNTMIRISKTGTPTYNRFDIISSGADASGTSWTLAHTHGAAGYTTTNSFVEHYAYVMGAADHSRETLGASYIIDQAGELAQYQTRLTNSSTWCFTDLYLDTSSSVAFSSATYVYKNGLTKMYATNFQLYCGAVNESRRIYLTPTTTSQVLFVDFMTGCDLYCYPNAAGTSIAANVILDGLTIGTINAPQTTGMYKIKLFSDAPMGTHCVKIQGISGYLFNPNKFQSYITKKPTCSAKENITHQEFARLAEHKVFPQGISPTDNSLYMTAVDQGVTRKYPHRYFKVDGVAINAPNSSYEEMIYTQTTTGQLTTGFWGDGFTIRYYEATSQPTSALVEVSKNGNAFEKITAGTSWLNADFTVSSYNNLSRFNVNYYNVSSCSTPALGGAGLAYENLPLDYYQVKLTYLTASGYLYTYFIDTHSPTYDFKSHYLYDHGGNSAYNRLINTPTDSNKIDVSKKITTYYKCLTNPIIRQTWNATSAAGFYTKDLYIQLPPTNAPIGLSFKGTDGIGNINYSLVATSNSFQFYFRVPVNGFNSTINRGSMNFFANTWPVNENLLPNTAFTYKANDFEAEINPSPGIQTATYIFTTSNLSSITGDDFYIRAIIRD